MLPPVLLAALLTLLLPLLLLALRAHADGPIVVVVTLEATPAAPTAAATAETPCAVLGANAFRPAPRFCLSGTAAAAGTRGTTFCPRIAPIAVRCHGHSEIYGSICGRGKRPAGTSGERQCLARNDQHDSNRGRGRCDYR